MCDLLIKNTKMPETCNKCFFTRHCDVHARQVQKMKESEHEQVFDVFGEMRLDGCPLVEIPKNCAVLNLEDLPVHTQYFRTIIYKDDIVDHFIYRNDKEQTE